ncbi:hypothetical protein GCM10022271_00550 [Corallibacter vietnamensis]|uniref:DUF1735 domain-containing protein n=1 Tax=Corallibacter vietnamensis TaxID=904130 RepID=A0ABP7GPL7_9FLAO
MKYIKNIILSSIVALGITSCNDDDTEYIYSVKPGVTIDNVSRTSVTEGESFTVTLNVDTPYKETLDFKLEIVSGGDMSDFNIGADSTDPDAPTTVDDGFGLDGYLIRVPAYTTSYTFTINPLIDLEVEGTDKYVFKLRSSGNGNGKIVGNDSFSIDVDNYTNNTLGVELHWAKDQNYQYLDENIIQAIDANGQPFTYTDDDEIINDHGDLCGIVDFDTVLVDLNSGSLLAYISGTSACPEIALESQVLPDGYYGIGIDLYDINFGFRADESLIGSFAIPFNLKIGKTGIFKTELSNNNLFFTYDTLSGDNGGNFSGLKIGAAIEVVGGKYTVYDSDGNLVAQEQ